MDSIEWQLLGRNIAASFHKIPISMATQVDTVGVQLSQCFKDINPFDNNAELGKYIFT